MEPTLLNGLSKLNNFFPIIPLPHQSAYPMSLAIWLVMLLDGINGCIKTNFSQLGMSSPMLLSFTLDPQLLRAISKHYSSCIKQTLWLTINEILRLFNRIIRLPNQAIIDYFISGLRADIQHELADLHPTSISQAIGLAKLVETKIQATRPLQYFSS